MFFSALFMGELGVSFFAIFLHNSLMNILQRIFFDHYEEIKYTLHPRNSEMENIDKMITCGDPSFGGACMAVLTAISLSLFLFVATAVSVLPAVTNTPWTALPVCPLNWFMFNTAIVSSPLMKIFVIFSLKTVLCLIVCFIQ